MGCDFTPRSDAERLALLDGKAWSRRVTSKTALRLAHHWPFWRRDDQVPPEGHWRCWFVMAGRGFGKTRIAAEWVRERAEADGNLRIALVGATQHEARTIMIEGESGLLAIAPPGTIKAWEPSLRRLTWASGAIGTLYSAAEPESLRGPAHHIGWADEIAKWDEGVAAWDNLAMTLRLGGDPRIVATSTPRAVPLVRRLAKETGVAVTGGRARDNLANLPPNWAGALAGIYGGTRLGRQELDGELIEDLEGALWSRDTIEAARVAVVPELKRVVIGVDPPAGTGGDACGIVAAGLDADGIIYVLGDASVWGESPSGWARAVAAAAAAHGADRVIAEANNGGKMVEETLRGADVEMPVRLVHASRGKVTRAEPVAARYETGRVKHAAAFPELEDEMCGLTIGGGYQGPGRSPDRADALVWAVTELMGRQAKGVEPRIRVL